MSAAEDKPAAAAAADGAPPSNAAAATVTAADEPPAVTARKYSSVKAVGMAEDRNARYRRTMEDQHVVADTFGGVPGRGYFGIYDGHGGRAAVDYIAKNLHERVREALPPPPDHAQQQQQQREAAAASVLEAALVRGFAACDAGIAAAQIQFSGATVVAALIADTDTDTEPGRQRTLCIANAGDARAVLRRNGQQAVRLSYDHKASDEQEARRVQAAGGFVASGRVNGMLAVTRSLGDVTMKDYVISQPFTSTLPLTPDCTHLILACDGLWDVVSDQEACDLAAAEDSAQTAAEKLLLTALRKGTTDNISVMVLEL